MKAGNWVYWFIGAVVLYFVYREYVSWQNSLVPSNVQSQIASGIGSTLDMFGDGGTSFDDGDD